MNILEIQIKNKKKLINKLLNNINNIKINIFYDDQIAHYIKTIPTIVVPINNLRNFVLKTDIIIDYDSLPSEIEEIHGVIWFNKRHINFFKNFIKKYPFAKQYFDKLKNEGVIRYANNDTPELITPNNLNVNTEHSRDALREIIFFWTFGISMDQKYKYKF